MDFPQPELTITFLIVVLAACVGYWVIRLISRGVLMRCPETGAVAFVNTNATPAAKDAPAEVVVCRCDLWPDKAACKQGCLARLGESGYGYRINIQALRPFDQQ